MCMDQLCEVLWDMQVSVSGDGQLVVVHAPLPYPRSFSQAPSNGNTSDIGGHIYTFKLVRV